IVGMFEWDWEAGEAHFRRALYLNPGYATTHHWFSCDFLPVVGRLDEAIREVDIALALDPLSPIIAESKAFLFMIRREYAEAEAQLFGVRANDPTFYKAHSGLGRVYIQMGRYAEALEQLERARALVGDLPALLGAMAQAHGLSGQTDTAREILGKLQ